MVEDLNPHEVCEEDTIERLAQVTSALTRRLSRLKEDVKARKYRHRTQLLEEPLLSCSQFSVLQSQELLAEELSQSLSQQSLEEDHSRPTTYKYYGIYFKAKTHSFFAGRDPLMQTWTKEAEGVELKG